MTRMKKPRRDVAQDITDRIIKALEAGALPWKKPWICGPAQLPLRNNGAPYTGMNVLLLWDRADEMTFENPRWMTFRQATELGGHVRKGEKSVPVIYYGSATRTQEDGTGAEGDETYRFLKSYPVFNVDQIDDLPAEFYQHQRSHLEKNPPRSEREAFFAAIGAEVRHGGDHAFYRPSGDFIQMPRYGAFRDPEHYFATRAHETIHWSGASHRLDRTKGKMFGDPQYAFEELVAEIGSAMLGAATGLPPDHLEDHTAYIGSWLKALKNDKRFILKAAADAQKAADFVLARAGHVSSVSKQPDAGEAGIRSAA